MASGPFLLPCIGSMQTLCQPSSLSLWIYQDEAKRLLQRHTGGRAGDTQHPAQPDTQHAKTKEKERAKRKAIAVHAATA